MARALRCLLLLLLLGNLDRISVGPSCCLQRAPGLLGSLINPLTDRQLNNHVANLQLDDPFLIRFPLVTSLELMPRISQNQLIPT